MTTEFTSLLYSLISLLKQFSTSILFIHSIVKSCFNKDILNDNQFQQQLTETIFHNKRCYLVVSSCGILLINKLIRDSLSLTPAVLYEFLFSF